MNLGSMKRRTAGMKKQARELIEQAYNRGYEEGKGQAWSEEVKKYEIEPDKKNEYIEQGRKEAWDAAQKLFLNEEHGGLKQEDFVSLFGGRRPVMVLAYTSATEVIEKLHTHEEQKKKDDEEIHIGDEVAFNHPGGTKYIVVSLSNNDKTFDGLSACGAEILLDKNLVTKTGRTFPEVAEFMKKLKEK